MNKVMLEGYIGRDPEIKFLVNGSSVANTTLATSNDYKPKGSGDWVKKPASWHNIVAFGKDAEALCTYIKGDKLAVEGKISYEEWTDKDGNKRTTTKIVCFGIVPKEGKTDEKNVTDDQVPF